MAWQHTRNGKLVIERAMILVDESEQNITVHDLVGTPFQSGNLNLNSENNLKVKDYIRQETAKVKKEQILIALKEWDGNVTHAAKHLKDECKSLQNKMREYDLR